MFAVASSEVKALLKRAGVLCFASFTGAAFGADPFVERVSGCASPTPVFHRHGQVRLLRCENNLLKGNEERHFLTRQFDPECGTVAVASGPGMRGIAPALCHYLTGETTARFPVQVPRSVLAAVAALRSKNGNDFGTGVLVAPNVILTAGHVAKAAEDFFAPVAAVFDSVQSERCGLAALDDQVSFNLRLLKNGLPDTLLVGKNVDYAFLELMPRDLVASSSTKPTASQITRERFRAEGCSLVELQASSHLGQGVLPTDFGFKTLPVAIDTILKSVVVGSSVAIIGFTQNIFFPRGMIVSAGGQVVTYDARNIQTSVHYNTHTEGGFSGGPILDDEFRWIGIHTKGYSSLEQAEALSVRRFNDFSRPNGGHLLRTILADMLLQIDVDAPPAWLEKTQLLEALKSSRSASK